MARISKERYEQQQQWMSAVQRALAVRKDWRDLFRVDMARQYLDGKQNPGYPENEWITVNKVYSHLKAKLPSLYSADPYFYVRLKRAFTQKKEEIEGFEQMGKIRSAMLNYYKEELELKNKARVSIQDSQFAYGVLKVHYHVDQQKNQDAGKPMLSESLEEPTPLLDEQTKTPIMEPEYIPVNERYCLTRVHPDDFVWDEDAGPLPDDWHWVAQRIREPLSEMQKNPAFDKRALKDLEGRGEAGMDEEQKERQRRKKGASIGDATNILGPSERKATVKETARKTIVERWEIYKLREKKWLVIADGAEVPLIEEQDLPPGIEQHPYAILRFTLRDDSPYPIPPMSQGLDPAKEFNIARSRILTHRKRFNRKYQVLHQALVDEAEMSKLETGDDGTCIRVNVLPAVAPIQDASLDQMGYMELTALNNDMTELFGGEHGEARGIAQAESATQAGILDKRLEMREGDDLSQVVDWIRVVARKLDQLIKAHIQADEAVRVVGPEGVYWELVRQSDYEDIQGEYGYDVNVGATMPRLPQMERASWQAFLTLLATFPQLMMSKRLLKMQAENHHIEDETMVEELHSIGQKMMGGQLPMPGGQGSQPGVPEDRPVSAIGGQAGGVMSMPGGGGPQ